jgi:SAM-dependent methyltransferase
MREDARTLEAGRMSDLSIENYPWIHERHRAFPEVFEDRRHQRVIDLAAGIGVIAKIIRDSYDCELTCNEIDETCLRELRKLGVVVTSFDLDTEGSLPIQDEYFDAVLSLVTLEHIMRTENHIKEMRRILAPSGRLYLSVPNISSLYHMIPVLRGRSFHNPLNDVDRYEFYAHVRYFGYYTLTELFESQDFYVDTVYLTLPAGSARYKQLRERSRLAAFAFRNASRILYSLSPRWHPGPIFCFSKLPLGRKARVVKI